jgi:thymidylate synthase (FAD)
MISKADVLDKGFVELLDTMGSDRSIDKAARVSFMGAEDEERTDEQVQGLINYLMRHRHTSPFEMAEMQFLVRCPIFVARQWMRHRTAAINEISGRYVELPDEWYEPAVWRAKAANVKQGSAGTATYTDNTFPILIDTDDLDTAELTCQEIAFETYRTRLESGVCNEMARIDLPLSTYTEFVWKIDLHNLLHFLRLRLDSHAQYEIRVYAETIAEMVKAQYPMVWEAFEKYQLTAITLTVPQLQALINVAEGRKIEDSLDNVGSAGEKSETRTLISRIMRLRPRPQKEDPNQ